MKRIAWTIVLLVCAAFATALLAAFAQRAYWGEPKAGVTVGLTLGVVFIILLVLRRSSTPVSKRQPEPRSDRSMQG
jgi:cytochrome b561